METLNVTILGRAYKIACKSDEKQALMRAVNVVEMKMSSIRDVGKVVGIDKIAVLAALQIAHEAIVGGQENTSSLGFDFESLERKVRLIDSMVDEALKKGHTTENQTVLI